MTARPIALLALAALAIMPSPRAGAPLLDAVLAEVEGQIITASDVALARALSLFGLSPSSEPIGYDDVERLITARLVVNEARRLGIGATEPEVKQAWDAATGRVGGPGALDGWLELTTVGLAWARAMVAGDLDWRRFIDLRFRAFVFVPIDDVLAELGPGDHPPEARARARATLAEREVERRLTEWRAESEPRLTVRRLLAKGDRVDCPLPMID